jgi:cytidylate kinase
MNNYVVAITRTCGSGGTTIARMLAKELNIGMYDRELLRLASDDSGINQELFIKADEDMKRKPLFRASKAVYTGELIPPESKDYTSNNNLFNFQAKVLKELTHEESYVIIGRAADFILKDFPNLIRVFIHADNETCISHTMEYYGMSHDKAMQYISTTNEFRSSYYKYYSGREWRNVENYDLSLDTGKYSYGQCSDIIKIMIKKKALFR